MILKSSFQPFKILSDPEEYFEREDLDEDIENQVLSDTPPIKEEEDYPYTDFEEPTVDGFEDPELYDAEEECEMSDMSEYDDEDRAYEEAIDEYDGILDNPEDLAEDLDDEYEDEDEDMDLSEQDDDGIEPSPFDEYDDIGIVEDPDLTEV